MENLEERFNKLDMHLGPIINSDEEQYYVIALDNEGRAYTNSLVTFNTLDEVKDYLYKQESLERGALKC